MAIQIDKLISKFNLIIPNAYVKLLYFRWSPQDMKGIATFGIYVNEETANENNDALETVDIDVTSQFTGIQAQMYAEIKKHPDYLDATDT